MKSFLAILVIALSLHAGAAHAQPPEREHIATATAQRVSLDAAVAIAQRRVPGQVVGADTRNHRGRIVHEVRILDEQGRLHIVRVDGASGRVVR